jgi:hypothetical protein
VKEFSAEVGVEAVSEEKLTLKQKDIPEEGILKIYDLKIS